MTIDSDTEQYITRCQTETGEFTGPELANDYAFEGRLHDRAHILHHLTCTAIPVCLHFGIPIPHPLTFAHRYCDPDFLAQWLAARDLAQAWFEGNNILFVGQLLIYLRDVERHPGASAALRQWFDWLDRHADPATSLWGTNGFCSAMDAVYGGYHQLLVYYHENHPIHNPKGLVDTVLALQHFDGSFHPRGNGGACEDVDSVDILVHLYKRFDYRRGDIRMALRRCLRHILALQNPDGGFPYNRNRAQSHMGIPGTSAPPNVSTAFATWFRVHTLALIAQVLPDEPALHGIDFRFTNNLSMGWHQSWSPAEAQAVAVQGDPWRESLYDMRFTLLQQIARGQDRLNERYRQERRRIGRWLRRAKRREHT